LPLAGEDRQDKQDQRQGWDEEGVEMEARWDFGERGKMKNFCLLGMRAARQPASLNESLFANQWQVNCPQARAHLGGIAYPA